MRTPEEIKAYKHQWYLVNRDSLLAKERQRKASLLPEEKARRAQIKAAWNREYTTSGRRNEQARAYYAAHQRELAEYRKQWNAANKEKVRRYIANGRARETPEKREARLADQRARAKASREKDPERHRLAVALRRARGARPTGEDFVYAAVVRRDPCSYCGGPGGTMDHIMAVRDGGTSEWMNQTGACRSCNSRKKRLPLLFALHRLHVDLDLGAEKPPAQ